jgi:hypothetical protein
MTENDFGGEAVRRQLAAQPLFDRFLGRVVRDLLMS